MKRLPGIRSFRQPQRCVGLLLLLLLLLCLVHYLTFMFDEPAYERFQEPGAYLTPQQLQLTRFPLLQPCVLSDGRRLEQARADVFASVEFAFNASDRTLDQHSSSLVPCDDDTPTVSTTQTVKQLPLSQLSTEDVSNSTVVFVITAAGHTDRRQAIRRTWASEAKQLGAQVFFVIGRPSNGDEWAALKAEQSQQQDLLVYAFYDNYYSLVYKSIALLHWARAHCDERLYVIKVDDDVMINWWRLSQTMVEYRQLARQFPLFIGKRCEHTKPHRDPHNRWYIDRQSYPQDEFPAYTAGPMYVMNSLAVRALLDQLQHLPPIFLEDVYLTGILRKRIENAVMIGMPNHLKDLLVYACAYRKAHGIHKCSAKQFDELWPLLSRESDAKISAGHLPCPAWKDFIVDKVEPLLT